jgi:hypothetical protein
LTTVDKVKIERFRVGLVQALQECSGDVKSIEISIFLHFIFKVGTVKIEFGTYGHWAIEQQSVVRIELDTPHTVGG